MLDFKTQVMMAFLVMAGSSWACDTSYVDDTKDGSILVSPTGVDDTNNINCAAELAAEIKKDVGLTSGDFYIYNPIYVANFEGNIAGVSKALTTLYFRIPSNSCKYVPTAGIEVWGGKTSIRNMTLDFTESCNEDIDTNIVHYGVHFTSPGYGDCDERVTFGEVDRVVIKSNIKPSFWTHGIGVKKHQSCGSEDRLIGTFKLNRSEISGFVMGFLAEMVSGAQVDVNFNEFSQNYQSVLIENPNQNLGIYQNVFLLQDLTGKLAQRGFDPVGIELQANGANSPASTKISIHKNTFTDETSNESAVAIILRGREGNSVSAAITSNTITTQGSPGGIEFGGIQAYDINGGFISSNVVRGPDEFLKLTGNDWSIVKNSLNTTAQYCDMRISGDGNFVGSQDAKVCSYGDNYVAPQ